MHAIDLAQKISSKNGEHLQLDSKFACRIFGNNGDGLHAKQVESA